MTMRSLIWVFSIFSMTFCYSQSPIVSEIYFSNEVVTNALSEDKYGFLWFGTDKGLLMYNGYEEIAVELPKDNRNVKEITIADDKVYIGTISGSVYILDLEKRTVLTEISPFTKSPISSILIIKDIMYISTYGDGLYLLNGKNKMEKVKGLVSEDIYDIEFIKDQDAITIASDRGIHFYFINKKENTTVKIENLPDYIIVDQCINEKGHVIGATYNGSIFDLDPKTFKINTLYENKAKEKNVKVICNGNKLILLSGNKIHEISKEKHSILNLGLVQDKINSIFIDKENSLWVTIGKTKILRANLYFLNFESNLDQQIQSILYHGGNFYSGTNRGLFLLSNPADVSGEILLEGISITSLKAIDNKIWIGTLSNGLYIYDDISKKMTHINKLVGVNDNTVLDIEKIDDRKVEIATLAGVRALPIDYTDKKYLTSSASDIALQAYVYDIFKDSKGNVWYGKDQNGVTIISNGNKKDFKSITINKKNYKLGSVYSIAEGKSGDVFLSTTNNGIVKFNNDQWQLVENTFSISDPFTSLINVSENEILLIGGNAMKILDVNDLHVLPFQSSRTEQNHITYINNYTKADHDYYFPFGNKIVRYSGNGRPIKKHPLVKIENVFVNLEKVKQRNASFNQTQNNLQFYFTAGWLSNPSVIEYSYMLQGFDNNWRTTKDRTVSYPHLTPGDYKFMVKASESSKFIDEPVSTYEFKIERAFYNTFWFYALAILFLVGLIYYLQRRQRNIAVLKTELSRKMIEAELINLKKQLDPHFLFNTLNTLIGLIEVDPKKGVIYTEQLTDFFRYMAEVSNQEMIKLENELEIVKLYKEIVGQRFGDNLVITLDQNLLSKAYDKYLPPLSLQMLIENAIKHNEVSKLNPLIIDIYVEGEFIVVSNKKKAKMTKEKSLGIGNHNIYERYKLLNKTLPKVIETDTEYKYYLPTINY